MLDQSKGFLPSFPIRSQQFKNSRFKTQSKIKPLLELPNKICEELSMCNYVFGSKGKIRQYRNQNNYCEIRPSVMSPIRLNNVEISIPNLSSNGTPKSNPRKIYTSSINRRKSNENKVSDKGLKKIPQEIITTKISTDLKAQVKSIASKHKKSVLSNSTNFIKLLVRNKNSISTRIESPKKNLNTDKSKREESESASPSNFTPHYNFEIF